MDKEMCWLDDLHEEQKRRYQKRQKRKERIWILKWFAVGIIIGLIVSFLTGCGASDVATDNQVSVATEAVAEEPATDIPDETDEPVKETEHAEIPSESADATWNASTKEHNDITVNSLLKFDGNYIWNFSDCTAVGKGVGDDTVTETEADYGFTIYVTGDDSVAVIPYDNSETGIVPVSVTADLASGNYISRETSDVYEITGYSNCENGIGLIHVTFSDDAVLTAGVFKNDDRLYVANISKDTSITPVIVNSRLKFEGLMEQAGITEKDAVYTDPIYYPIVPVSSGEVTDTANWVNESFKIVEPDWSDAHKVMELYNYVIDNFAYDSWVIIKGYNARCFYYDDFSGKYYISQTHVGVCEDFAQVLAIMCRAQGIPALEIHSGAHAMTAVYIKNYGRWLLVDTTADIMHDACQEDPTIWTDNSQVRYSHLNSITDCNFAGIGIGNYADMKEQGIPMY